MKIATVIARILLGLVFVVFGLNPFLKFIPMQMPPGTAGQFLTVLFVSHFVYVVGAAQVIGGVLLLINRYVPLALTILGPVIVSILSISLADGPERAPACDYSDGALVHFVLPLQAEFFGHFHGAASLSGMTRPEGMLREEGPLQKAGATRAKRSAVYCGHGHAV